MNFSLIWFWRIYCSHRSQAAPNKAIPGRVSLVRCRCDSCFNAAATVDMQIRKQLPLVIDFYSSLFFYFFLSKPRPQRDQSHSNLDCFPRRKGHDKDKRDGSGTYNMRRLSSNTFPRNRKVTGVRIQQPGGPFCAVLRGANPSFLSPAACVSLQVYLYTSVPLPVSAVNGRNVTECLCESTKTRGEAQRGALFCTQVEGTGGARAIRTLDMIRFPIKKSSSYSVAVRRVVQMLKRVQLFAPSTEKPEETPNVMAKVKKLFGRLDVAQAGETTSLANFSSCLIYELKPLLLPYLYSRSLWIRAQPKG